MTDPYLGTVVLKKDPRRPDRYSRDHETGTVQTVDVSTTPIVLNIDNLLLGLEKMRGGWKLTESTVRYFAQKSDCWYRRMPMVETSTDKSLSETATE